MTEKHKAHSKATKHKESDKAKKQQNMVRYGIGAVAVAIILIIILLVQMSPGGKVIVTVDGEGVTQKQIDTEYDRLPPSFQEQVTKEDIINQTISKIVLLQEAEESGFTASEEEVDAMILQFKTASNLDDAQFEELLKEQNMELEELREIYTQQIMISKLADELLANVSVGDAEAKLYYEANKDSFIRPEQLRVSHILILVNDAKSDADALKEIEKIQKEITPTNFGDLAEKYSEDPGSNRNKGEYTFGRGLFVKEFEEAAFALEEGEVSKPVKTEFGYHIIKLLEKIPAGTAPFANVKDQIKQTLSISKQQKALNDYIQELRANADIKYS